MSKEYFNEHYLRIGFCYECAIEALAQRNLVHPGMIPNLKKRIYDTLDSELDQHLRMDRSIEESIWVYFRMLESYRDYVSLTELVRKYTDEAPGYVIQSWMRSKNTMEFLRIWELTFNRSFRDEACVEMLGKRDREGYAITPSKWVKDTNAMGIRVKRGKGGGITAHPDIALDFRMWLDPNYRHHLIRYVREH